MSDRPPRDRCRLYLVTPPRLDDPVAFADTLARALDGGDVACLQLRLKDMDDDAIRRAADALVPPAQARDVAVLMNDRPDLAVVTGCDGVHVGQEDTPLAEARAIVGTDRIVGVTCHDSRHLAMDAGEGGADYVAFGAFFPTDTKEAKARADIELLRWWAEAMVVPVVAIGGITPDNARPLIEAGADFLAVSSGVWAWPDGPQAAVARLNALMAAHSPPRDPA
jgi:thiamine-phosphate pyrophosphorylase